MKLVRDVEKGTIEVFFDDMETPCKVAEDKTFGWGMIGLGSFDDLGMWDDLRIEGALIEGKEPELPEPAGEAGPDSKPRPDSAPDRKPASAPPQVSQFRKVTADASQDGNPAAHAIDGDPTTRWAVQGKGHTLELELAKPGEIDRIGIGFTHGKRVYGFALQTSTDGKDWSEPWTSRAGKGDAINAFEFQARRPATCD